MKKLVSFIGVVMVTVSTLGLGLFMYIFSYGGVALDESISYVDYFNKLGMLQWVLLLLLFVSFVLSILNFIYIKPRYKHSK